MARPRKADSRDTRQVILDAALELFARNSYSATSMRMVAREVGVRESALYHHYPSKESILAALMQLHGPSRAKQLSGIDVDVVEHVGVKTFLRNLVQMMWSTWSAPTEVKFMRVLISEAARQTLPEELHPRAVIAGAKKSLHDFFAELMRRKLIRKGDPAAVTTAFMGPLMFMRLQYYVMFTEPPEAKQIRRELDGVVDLFWSAVAPESK